jgi:Trypsin
VKALAFASSLLVALVLSAPARAVDNGIPDGDRHPNVGLLGFDFDAEGDSPPFFLCSGSVLSDRAFLTAAHCIDVFDDTVQWVVSLEPGAPQAPVFESGFVFDDFPFAVSAPVERPLATIVHPRFDPETLAHDLAVLVFAPGTFDVRPVDLPRPRLLDALSRRPGLAGASFTLVGYGADPDYSAAEPRYFIRGYRQTATAPFLALSSGQLRLAGADAGGRGGLCVGDSGSPQFLGSSNTAVSQLSAVGETCREIVAQRLDAPADRGFLSRFRKGH